MGTCLFMCYNNFNPRSHEGSDFAQGKYFGDFKNFNPRSHEGSDDTDYDDSRDSKNFNPRSHEGSDHRDLDAETCIDDFNPRSHEGSDWQGLRQQQSMRISIRAPTRGATIRSKYCCRAVINFNPRSHEGSDRMSNIMFGNFFRFQSALPRGERQQFSPKSSLLS